MKVLAAGWCWCLYVVSGFVVLLLGQPSSFVVLVLVSARSVVMAGVQSDGTLLHNTVQVRVACLASCSARRAFSLRSLVSSRTGAGGVWAPRAGW
jgi:hypothetical protein